MEHIIRRDHGGGRACFLELFPFSSDGLAETGRLTQAKSENMVGQEKRGRDIYEALLKNEQAFAIRPMSREMIYCKAPFDVNLHALSSCKDVVFSQFVCHIIARLFTLERSDILSLTRGYAKAAFARQLAMYLCHVIGQQTLENIGLYFSRDRKTISYACERIEDLRDDERFNSEIERLEEMMSVVARWLAAL